MTKRNKYKLFASIIIVLVFTITTKIGYTQIQDPGGLGGNGIGQSGGPFDPPTNPSSGGSGLDPVTNPDPGGPTDPPPDVVPIDGGISVLLAVGLATGYKNLRRKKKNNIYKKD